MKTGSPSISMPEAGGEASAAAAAGDTDERLLARFVAGEVGALGELAERYEGQLLGLATGLMNGRRDLAEEVVQEAWVRVIRYGAGFEGASSFRTWVYRIVINRCRDVSQRERSRGTRAREAMTETAARVNTGEVADGQSDGLGDERVREAVAGLPAGTRLILLLCYHRGLTHMQAAEVLDLPVGTLKSRLSAALAELRAVLGAAGDGAGADGKIERSAAR